MRTVIDVGTGGPPHFESRPTMPWQWFTRVVWTLIAWASGVACLTATQGDMNAFVGTWRGSSTCVNRQIAPACQDETVIYEVRRADKPNTATLKADKVVDGQRVPMGELDFLYDEKNACWRSEFTTPRVHGVWCLIVQGTSMTGSLRVLPENADARKVQLTRQ